MSKMKFNAATPLYTSDAKAWRIDQLHAPPLYIQEKVHPKALIDDLLKETQTGKPQQMDLFADFNGIPQGVDKTEFYRHEQNWSNRMILGDSLQVKAFRDTWRDGIHSYLTYLRDRLTVARDLLTESGSVFVQIGDENVHRVRVLMDEVFGDENFCGLIGYKKTTGAGSPAIGTDVLASVKDYIVWFAKQKYSVKYRQLYLDKEAGSKGAVSYNRVQSSDGIVVKALRAGEDFERDYKDNGWHLVASDNLTSQTGVESTQVEVSLRGKVYKPAKGGWKTNARGLDRLSKASRTTEEGAALDFAVSPINNDWGDTSTGSFTEEKVYVVQSGIKAVQRCLLMATDPGDLVLDPTCGSGTANL